MGVDVEIVGNTKKERAGKTRYKKKKKNGGGEVSEKKH